MKSYIMKEPEVKKTLLTEMHFRSILEESAIARKENNHDSSHSQINNGLHPAKWRDTSQGWEEGVTTKPKYPPVVPQPHEKGRQVKTPNACRRLKGFGGSVRRIPNTVTTYLHLEQ